MSVLNVKLKFFFYEFHQILRSIIFKGRIEIVTIAIYCIHYTDGLNLYLRLKYNLALFETIFWLI